MDSGKQAYARMGRVPFRSISTGGIAQLVERQLCKLDVTGSSPVASTNRNRACSSVG